MNTSISLEHRLEVFPEPEKKSYQMLVKKLIVKGANSHTMNYLDFNRWNALKSNLRFCKRGEMDTPIRNIPNTNSHLALISIHFIRGFNNFEDVIRE